MVQATLEWENQEDGFLAKILVGDGSKDIPVGTPVAVITEEKEDVSLLYQLHAAVTSHMRKEWHVAPYTCVDKVCQSTCCVHSKAATGSLGDHAT